MFHEQHQKIKNDKTIHYGTPTYKSIYEQTGGHFQNIFAWVVKMIQAQRKPTAKIKLNFIVIAKVTESRV